MISPPRATMRLQLHKDFTFENALELVPYLASLGISHVYSSPILTARAGSIHGYDVIDPTRVNPELGGERELRRFVAGLRAAGIGLIVDIVPNHMAVGSLDNPWWSDMLRHGRASRYATFFDVDWNGGDPTLHNKVLAPFLGRPYGEALADGEILVSQTPTGEPVIAYFGTEFPVDPADYAYIAECGLEAFDPANPSGRAQIHALLERQHYRLAWWGTAGDEINWRRFFDINGLAGLRIEVPEVFEETHATLFRLYSEGLIDGFRIDHVDGLSDPPGYCRRLRHRLDELAPLRPDGAPRDRAYLVVEKILGAGEALSSDWDIDGTSGYDFMNEVSALQHDDNSADALGALWHTVSGRAADFREEEVPARMETLERGFESSLRAVTTALHRIARFNLETRDVSAPAIRRALIALLSNFPVYRGYNAGGRRSAEDQIAFNEAMCAAKLSSPKSLQVILDHIDHWLGGQESDLETNDLRQTAATLFHQLSAPVAAKSVEDTAFYRYGRLLSRNDVGFDAGRLGGTIGQFHEACLARLRDFPDSMLATATHDHKRGEDLRARLAVLSEIPDAWRTFVNDARSLPAAVRPDSGDEVMLYQMIIGAWPLMLDPADKPGGLAFAERLAGWQEKALREAKLRTDWVAPDSDYEAKARDFLFDLFSGEGRFLALAKSMVDQIAAVGALNGLVQTTLKLTVPGMPDFFQGSEFWDFSLVDPDNRRAVDYDSRRAALDRRQDPLELLPTWRDGVIKQSLIQRILTVRGHYPTLFARGTYIPVPVVGPLTDRIVAFVRTEADQSLLVAVPRHAAGILRSADELLLRREALADSALLLPNQLRGRRLLSIFGGNDAILAQAELALADVLADFPVGVLQLADAQ